MSPSIEIYSKIREIGTVNTVAKSDAETRRWCVFKLVSATASKTLQTRAGATQRTINGPGSNRKCSITNTFTAVTTIAERTVQNIIHFTGAAWLTFASTGGALSSVTFTLESLILVTSVHLKSQRGQRQKVQHVSQRPAPTARHEASAEGARYESQGQA